MTTTRDARQQPHRDRAADEDLPDCVTAPITRTFTDEEIRQCILEADKAQREMEEYVLAQLQPDDGMLYR